MVTLFEAYKAVNRSLYNLSLDINKLEKTDYNKSEVVIPRDPEPDFFVTEKTAQINPQLISAYNLIEYRRNFYIVTADSSEKSLVEMLAEPVLDIDLTQFNDEV